MPSHSHSHSQSCSSTALNVWWFGGSDVEQDDESCELVAIRIEKTSANSRRIAGDIIIPKPVDDVWAILTDYDNLSVHVPNLVESKRVSPASASKRISNPNGKQGDGSYQCTLYQKGAQKIVGFEFGASVTMDMAEHITTIPDPIGGGIAGEGGKKISFKCVDSQFFSVFDGEWKVSPTTDPEDPSKPASLVEYVVDVRPRGPVPVQALEWRIREDVPTNLRAVKVASLEVGRAGVDRMKLKQKEGRGKGNGMYTNVSMPPQRPVFGKRLIDRAAAASKNAVSRLAPAASQNVCPRLAPVKVNWSEDETMAAYLGSTTARRTNRR